MVISDHLNIGDSSRVLFPMKSDRHVGAAAHDAAATRIFDQLRDGTLHDMIPAIPKMVRVGGGHSMGGMQTITVQAAHRTYDRVLILGFTAIGVHLHHAGHLVSADPGPMDYTRSPYYTLDRTRTRESFHWDDVPKAVKVADDELVAEVPALLSHQSISTGIVSEDAGKIDCPVYICLGQRDVSPNPHAEPSYYHASSDVTLHILPRSGHCQNFASTRSDMVDRIDGWVRSLN